MKRWTITHYELDSMMPVLSAEYQNYLVDLFDDGLALICRPDGLMLETSWSVIRCDGDGRALDLHLVDGLPVTARDTLCEALVTAGGGEWDTWLKV